MIYDRNGNILIQGDSIKNYNPYDGECEKLIMSLNDDETDFVLVVYCDCEKYPSLTGQRETMSPETIEQYYVKV